MSNTNIFEKVTNLSEVTFKRDNGNNSYTPMAHVIPMVYPANAVKVYNFNLRSGAVKERFMNIEYSKTDSVKFERAYINYWYSLELDSIESEYAKFKKETPADETERAKMDVIQSRYDDAVAYLSGFKNVANVPETVKTLVHADRNMKEDKYLDSVRINVGKIRTALIALNDVCLNEDEKRDLSTVRKPLDKFCKELWQASEDGTCKKHVFKANARLTEEIWRVFLDKRVRDKTGKIVKSYVKTSDIIREIVLACFEELQTRDANAAKNVEAPATDDNK